MPKSKVMDAFIVFTIYFFCEWLPIFTVYLFHLQDFRAEFKTMRATKKEIVSDETTVESLIL